MTRVFKCSDKTLKDRLFSKCGGTSGVTSGGTSGASVKYLSHLSFSTDGAHDHVMYVGNQAERSRYKLN